MDYTICDKFLPGYYRPSYYGEYRSVHYAISTLLPNEIEALHYHRGAEVGICLSGSGVTHIDRRVYRFEKGDMQFVPPNVPHLSAADLNSESKWIWISFEPMRILLDSGSQGYDQIGQIRDLFSGVFHPSEHPWLASLIERLRFVAENRDSWSEMEFSFLAAEFMIECARLGNGSDEIGNPKAYSERLRPAIMYIREHYSDSDAMREEHIASVCNMSISHFRAVFKRETGLNIRNFVLQTRLAAATNLLRRTDESILTVASEAGFTQISCFNRTFMRAFGMTPSGYRKKCKNE